VTRVEADVMKEVEVGREARGDEEGHRVAGRLCRSSPGFRSKATVDSSLLVRTYYYCVRASAYTTKHSFLC
jgi:hypothetical protein